MISGTTAAIGIAVGVLVTLVLGHAVRNVVDAVRALRVRQWRNSPVRDEKDKNFEFERVFDEPEKPTEVDWPTTLLGIVERVLFFGSLWVDAGVVVAAWLGLKVASKWQSWALAKERTALSPALQALYVEIGYLRFLVGTAMNVIIALVGVGVGRWVVRWLAG